MDEQEIEDRVHERAHRIWEEEGRPEGKAEVHWDLARLVVSLEDAKQAMRKPIKIDEAESIEAIVNQGEFPTLTDQGESLVHGALDDEGA